MTDDQTAFLNGIIDKWGDALPRMLFADWLQEQGRDREAAGQRWLATTNRWPSNEGWYRYEMPSLPKDHSVLRPDIFWPKGVNSKNFYHVISAMEAEEWFLQRSAELDWTDGKPSLPKLETARFPKED